MNRRSGGLMRLLKGIRIDHCNFCWIFWLVGWTEACLELTIKADKKQMVINKYFRKIIKDIYG